MGIIAMCDKTGPKSKWVNKLNSMAKLSEIIIWRLSIASRFAFDNMARYNDGAKREGVARN